MAKFPPTSSSALIQSTKLPRTSSKPELLKSAQLAAAFKFNFYAVVRRSSCTTFITIQQTKCSVLSTFSSKTVMKGVKRDKKILIFKASIILSNLKRNQLISLFSVHVINCPIYIGLIENKIVKNVSNILVFTLCDE